MNIFQLSEKQKKSIGFGLITSAWVVAIFLVIGNYVERSKVNTESRLKSISKADARMDEQEDLIEDMNELFHEIRVARFEVYQDYYLEDLVGRIRDLEDEKSPNKEFRRQGVEILEFLLFSRQKLVKEEGNLIKIELAVKDCRDGKIDSESE